MKNKTVLSIIIMLAMSLIVNSLIGYGEGTSIYPNITVLVYPDSAIEIKYVLTGQIPVHLNISSGYIDYMIRYEASGNTTMITIAGGGELVYGKPSGAPVNRSIVFIGLNTDTHSNPVNLTSHTLGVALVNIDENINGVSNHLTLNASKIIVNSTPDAIKAFFVLDVRGSTNTSLFDRILGYNLSELNIMLEDNGYKWIVFTSYNTSVQNNTYRIAGSFTINLSMLLNNVLNRSPQNNISSMKECVLNLYKITGVKTRLAQAYWSEEYVGARRTGVKTDFTIILSGDPGLVGRLSQCLPDYARLLLAMVLGSPNTTISLIDLSKHTRIPGLIPQQPYSLHIHVRSSITEKGVEFNLTIDSGKLYYNASGLPVEERIEKALEAVKGYLENLTALLEPYRIVLGAEHLVPATINVRGVSVNGLKILVEPETIELFRPVELKVSIARVSLTTSTTITQTKPMETTTTITTTKTIKETYTVTTTIQSTTTITKSTVIQETVTKTIRAVDTGELLITIAAGMIASAAVTYIVMRRRT